jgi:SAM-dependent methyltransferase
MAVVLDRVRSELAFHDRQAFGRAEHFRSRPELLRFGDDSYLDHETWIRPALALLGDLRGLEVLDFGCGHGMAAVVLARLGGRVTAFDLAPGYVAEAGLRAGVNGVSVRLLAANGERLPFADGSFDRVWGNAVLHHLDLAVAAAELHRVLRPGGRAVFCEPWGGNPLLNWARRSLPYPGKERTADESPLTPRQLRLLRQDFGGVELQGHQLLSMVQRVLPGARWTGTLERADSWLLRGFPGLQRFCRYMVLTLERRR